MLRESPEEHPLPQRSSLGLFQPELFTWRYLLFMNTLDCQGANCITQSDDLRLLSPTISAYSAAARGRAAAGNQREGRGDRARVVVGGPLSGKGAPLFKQWVPGRPARPAWAGEHAGLQGRVAPKTLGMDPYLPGSQLGGPVWSELGARGTFAGRVVPSATGLPSKRGPGKNTMFSEPRSKDFFIPTLH